MIHFVQKTPLDHFDLVKLSDILLLSPSTSRHPRHSLLLQRRFANTSGGVESAHSSRKGPHRRGRRTTFDRYSTGPPPPRELALRSRISRARELVRWNGSENVANLGTRH